MLRKKLGKDVKETKPSNTPKPVTIGKATIDKEKISQIEPESLGNM